MSDESKKTEGSKTEWVIPKQGIPEIYSDYFHANWLGLAVRVRLGQIVADPTKPPHESTFVVAERAALTMPWATVKAFNEFLTKLVAAFEKTNGEITIPKLPDV